jgi:hypothetical protein
MKRLSKGSYVTAIAGLLAVIFVISFMRGLPGATADPLFAVVMGFSLLFLFVGLSIVTCVLVYRMWASIQDGHARMTPAKAVGFLFIPLFSVYWIFQVLCGFATDYNAHVSRRHLRLPKLNRTLFLACILLYFAMGLSGGVLAVLAASAAAVGSGTAIEFLRIASFFYLAIAATSYGVWVTVIVKFCDAVNALTPVSQDDQIRSDPDRQGLALYCAFGEFAGNNVPLPADGIVIGRSPARAQLVLSSSSISAAHAQVWPDHNGSGVWVKDMESTNGTFYLNGHASAQPSEWLPIRAPKLLARRAHFRLAEDGAEFEIR